MKNLPILILATALIAAGQPFAAGEGAAHPEEPAKAPNLNSEAVMKQLAELFNGLLTPEQKERMKMGGWGAPQLGAPSAGDVKTGAAQVRAPGSPQVFKFGEGGDGISITINGDGKVSTQPGTAAGAGRTFVLGEGRAQTEKGPWLGITTEPVSDALRAQLSLAKGEGLLVGQVVSRSPAAAAGLVPNDVLLRLDDQIIVELSQLRTLIAMKKAGDQVKLVYVRKAARQEATATLAEHEIEVAAAAQSQWLQAVPGLSKLFEGGGQELAERLEPLVKQFMGNALGATLDKGNHSTTPAPGTSPNPNTWKREPVVGAIENLRRQLEISSVPPETKEKIRKSIDQASEAAEKARAALEEALKQTANVPQDGRFKRGDAPNPAPLNPAPPNPAPKNP